MATAGVKISSLRELNTAEDTDYIVINDVSASTTKKISRGNFLKDIMAWFLITEQRLLKAKQKTH